MWGAGVLIRPGKRKFSPQPGPQVDGNPTKTACHSPDLGIIKRSNSISGGSSGLGLSKRKNKLSSSRRRLMSNPENDPRQQRLTTLWKKNNKDLDKTGSMWWWIGRGLCEWIILLFYGGWFVDKLTYYSTTGFGPAQQHLMSPAWNLLFTSVGFYGH